MRVCLVGVLAGAVEFPAVLRGISPRLLEKRPVLAEKRESTAQKRLSSAQKKRMPPGILYICEDKHFLPFDQTALRGSI